MTGSAPASSGDGASASSTSTDSGVVDAVDGQELTTTADVPIPVSPFAIAGYARRRRECFNDGIRYCKR